MKERWFTPGPVQVPETVLAAMAAQPPHPRSEVFRARFREISAWLQEYFQTVHDVLVLTASGTAAMEAAIANFLCRHQLVVTVDAGLFGARWAEIARHFDLRVATVARAWGESLSAEHLRHFLRQQRDVAAVCLTHSETSTGVVHDVRALAEAVRAETDALVVVDGISAVGVVPFRMDQWAVDVCVCGSQKAAMVPPGLAFLAVGERAWRRAAQADLPRYYLDCRRAREGLAGGSTPWTAATSLLMGLHEALRLILAEGLSARWARASRQAAALRRAVVEMGLSLFARVPGNAVTAVQLPESIHARRFVGHLRARYGMHVAEGQAAIKQRVFRVGHMGWTDYSDLLGLVAAIEFALEDFRHPVKRGTGLTAMQISYRHGD